VSRVIPSGAWSSSIHTSYTLHSTIRNMPLGLLEATAVQASSLRQVVKRGSNMKVLYCTTIDEGPQAMLPGGPWFDHYDILRVQSQLPCILTASRPRTLAIYTPPVGSCCCHPARRSGETSWFVSIVHAESNGHATSSEGRSCGDTVVRMIASSSGRIESAAASLLCFISAV
jgi:hypothetical protein